MKKRKTRNRKQIQHVETMKYGAAASNVITEVFSAFQASKKAHVKEPNQLNDTGNGAKTSRGARMYQKYAKQDSKSYAGKSYKASVESC
ncbi:hypothetical protein GcC1_198011 [Golovinomyces cichoracearum]|uniref:Uncharacterized protein n=1 Tax=Golovinomyces cichoracearum TaxID=62708 RepID=A0A420HFK1_9PEZI|nr:hypothetical protein GcC1_198011 [Golovinomyces cichoracearum]